MKILNTIGALAIATLVVSTAASAQGTMISYKRAMPAKLVKRVKIQEDSAAKIAQAKVPDGRIQSMELEQEKGKLIYSYDIKIPGKSGIEEVNVNAIDGRVVGVEHETAKTEAAEKQAEAKKKP